MQIKDRRDILGSKFMGVNESAVELINLIYSRQNRRELCCELDSNIAARFPITATAETGEIAKRMCKVFGTKW